MADEAAEDLLRKLKIDDSGHDSEYPDGKIESFEQNLDLEEESEGGSEEDDENGDFEFSFPSVGAGSSPISADDAFHNGQIRPMFPFPDDEAAPGPSQPEKIEPLRKFFTAEEEAEGTVKEIKSADGLGQKSNSTGSSRLRRFRDLVHRSSSDGKDAFVFLSPAGSGITTEEKKAKKAEKKEKGKKASASSAAALETHYGKNRAAVEKRRSYLPYRPGLVGFFTNVNGLSKNVHPF